MDGHPEFALSTILLLQQPSVCLFSERLDGGKEESVATKYCLLRDSGMPCSALACLKT